MVDVDVRGLWSSGKGVFAIWFASATLIGSLLFVRYSARLTFAKSVVAAAAMTLLSWLFVVVMPVSLVVALSMQYLIFHGNSNPVSWTFAVLMSAILGTALGAAILAGSRQRMTKSGFAILFALNLVSVALAVYRMVSYVIAHPPEA